MVGLYSVTVTAVASLRLLFGRKRIGRTQGESDALSITISSMAIAIARVTMYVLIQVPVLVLCFPGADFYMHGSSVCSVP
jgi:hypothetical protein